MFAKQIEDFTIGRLERTEEANARYSNPDNDPRGVWKPSDMSVKTYNAACDYPITTPSGKIVEPPAGRCWRSLEERSSSERLRDNRISWMSMVIAYHVSKGFYLNLSLMVWLQHLYFFIKKLDIVKKVQKK